MGDVFSYLHDKYDVETLTLLTSLETKEKLQDFIRASISQGILEPDPESESETETDREAGVQLAEGQIIPNGEGSSVGGGRVINQQSPDGHG